MVTTARHLSLSWARRITSTTFHSVSLRSILTLRSLSVTFAHQHALCTSLHLVRATLPAHPILIILINRTIQIANLLTVCSFLQSPATSSCLSPNTRWFKYDRDYLCVNKSQFVPVIFEPPCIFLNIPFLNISFWHPKKKKKEGQLQSCTFYTYIVRQEMGRLKGSRRKWTGFLRLCIGTCAGLLWTWQWTFGFNKYEEFLDWLRNCHLSKTTQFLDWLRNCHLSKTTQFLD
jgi:hypothetical protein